MIMDLLKTVVLSKITDAVEGEAEKQTQPSYLIPQLNLTKYMVKNPTVETARVVSAETRPDTQATSKYFALMEAIMRTPT
jgi:uncharacterized protein (UPF0261 family)